VGVNNVPDYCARIETQSQSLRRTQVIGWVFVGVQIILLGSFILLPGSEDWPVANSLRTVARLISLAGLVLIFVAAIGLGTSLTATPVPKQDAVFRSGGLYRIVRHPIYTGVLAYVVGSAIVSRSYWKLAVCLLIVLFFNVKARWEEAQLRAAFPEYDEYAHRTPRFFPRIRTK
jgi:protein-S-isoprenylcysteine O-methyltransferase Ste14